MTYIILYKVSIILLANRIIINIVLNQFNTISYVLTARLEFEEKKNLFYVILNKNFTQILNLSLFRI